MTKYQEGDVMYQVGDMVAAWNQSPWMPFAFVIPFLSVLIGVKILIAVTFHRSKEWMSDGGLLCVGSGFKNPTVVVAEGAGGKSEMVGA